MRILLCPLYEDTFSSRFRIYRYLPYWGVQGVDCTVVPAALTRLYKNSNAFPRLYHRWRFHLSEILRRRRSILDSTNFDLVVIQKGFTTIDWSGWLPLLEKQKVPFIFDIDDGNHLQPGLTPPKLLRRWWDEKQIEKIGRSANAVVVGNRYLAEDYCAFARRVEEIPTSLDLQVYTYTEEDRQARRQRADDGQFRIGWSGSSSSHPLLNQVLPVVARLHEKYPFVRMHIISNTEAGIAFDLLKDTPVTFTSWTPDTEVPAIKEMDAGLMPLTDSPWMKYKCALKALQYMAVGAVAVCSPVGVNADIIQPGQNGFLAQTDEEWYSALENLIQNRKDLDPIREQARQTVEADFSIETNSKRWVKLMEETITNYK